MSKFRKIEFADWWKFLSVKNIYMFLTFLNLVNIVPKDTNKK